MNERVRLHKRKRTMTNEVIEYLSNLWCEIPLVKALEESGRYRRRSRGCRSGLAAAAARLRRSRV